MAQLRAISGARELAHPTLLDWSTLEAALRNLDTDEDSRERRFKFLIAKQLFNLEPTDPAICITDGGDDRGIDVVVIDYDEKKVHLVSTKFVHRF